MRMIDPDLAFSMLQESNLLVTKQTPGAGGQSRRVFLKKTASATAAAASIGVAANFSEIQAGQSSSSVALVLDPALPLLKQPPVQWAIEQLTGALTGRGVTTKILRN